ncbi:MAG TPA: alpha/beta hydrolase [Xanthomonadales bacterium]|nr:alpha/beta hydrolase [Xanthomonadales bacterium]
MKLQRRELLLGALATGLYRTGSAQIGSQFGIAPPVPTALWPGEAPGMPIRVPTESLVERSTDSENSDRAITGISLPRLEMFRPENSNGASLMIIPGGGYQHVTIDKEGFDPALWFAARGFTVFVLIYRLPGDSWVAGPDVALSDAQRGIRLIRSRADDYGIDPVRVAALGFSAGGHVCAHLATRFDAATYEPIDSADTFSARPFVAAPIYPVISMSAPIAHTGTREALIGKDARPQLERAQSAELTVSDDACPCFLLHAEDDESVDIQNTLEFRAALHSRGIPVETHLFAHGGHGFGLRQAQGKPVGQWPDLFMSWSQSMGLF